MSGDMIHHPAHYSAPTWCPVECIVFTRHMTFCAGNAFKYVWRHLSKGTPVTDLDKADVYLNWAIEDMTDPWVSVNARARLDALRTAFLMNAPDEYRALAPITQGDYGDGVYYIGKQRDALL